MKIEGDDVIFNSGRKDWANCGIIGLGPDFRLSGGYDHGFPLYNHRMTRAERQELADYMIEQWKAFREL